jgi:hypothetical protein
MKTCQLALGVWLGVIAWACVGGAVSLMASFVGVLTAGW